MGTGRLRGRRARRQRVLHRLGARQAGRCPGSAQQGRCDLRFDLPQTLSHAWPATAVEGNRNNDLNTLIYRLAQEGQKTFYKERDTAIASGLPATEVDTTIHSALEAATRSTFPKKDARALESVFEQLGWKPRYNTRSMSTEFSLDGGTTWKSTNDRTEKKTAADHR